MMAFVSHSLAQTITVNQNISPTTGLCTGSTVTLTFTTSGTFTAGNVFRLERSEADGTFPASPVSVTTLTASPASASATSLSIAGTLGSVTYGIGYRFRITSSAPARTSTNLTNPVTIGTPLPTTSGNQPNGTFAACQNSGLLSLTANGSNLSWYENAGATTPNPGPTYGFRTDVTPNTYTVAFTQTSSSGCVSGRASVNVLITAPPSTTPTVAGLREYCPGAGGQLTASGSGTSFRWINLADNSAQTAATINAPSTSGTYNFSISQFNTANGVTCEGPRGVVTITVYNVPDKPNLEKIAVAYCQGDTPPTLSVTNLAAGNKLTWTFPNNSQVTNTGPISAPAVVPYSVYSVVQSNTANCSSAPTSATVTINTPPGNPTLSTSNNGPFCQFSGTNNVQSITASKVIGGKVFWYDSSTDTTPTEGDSYTISTVNSGDIQVYFRQQSDKGCFSSATPVSATVRINPKPAAPTAISAPNNYCANDASAQPRLSATLLSGATIKWYNLTDNTTSADATLAAPSSTKRYQVTQTLNSCESDRSDIVTVTVKGNPGTASLRLTSATAFCQNSGTGNVQTITAAGDANAVIEWYPNLTTSAPLSASGNSFTVSTATAEPDPLVYFQQRVDGCASTRISRAITINPTPAKPSVSQSYSVCLNAQAETLSNVSTGQGLRWFEGNTERSGTYRPATSTVGTSTTFAVTQTINGCEGLAETLRLTVYGLPDKPTAVNYNYCSAQAPVTLSASGSAIRWYTQAGGFLAPGSTYPAPNTANTYNYKVTQTDARNCQSDFLDVAVVVRPTPGAPGLPNPNPIFCQTRSAQPLAATGENLVWTDASGNALPGAPTPSTSGLGTQRFYVTQTNSASCTSTTALVSVTINAVPGQPTFTTPRQYCSGETADLLVANGQDLRWYDVASGGTGSTNAIRPNTSPNPSDVTAVRTYYVTQTVGSCESDRREIPVTIKRKPGLPGNVPGNPEFCRTYGAPTLSATTENGASLIWVVDGRDTPNAPTAPNDRVGTYSYAVAQTLNGCRSDNAPFTVRVKDTPGQPGVSLFTLCQGGPSRQLSVQGERPKYYDANNNLLNDNPTPSTAQVTTIVYKVSQTNSEGCESPKVDYPVIVYAVPAPPTVRDLQYCLVQRDQPQQDIKPLTAEGANIRWYNSDNTALGGAPNPQPDGLRTERYFVTQTVNNCQSNNATVTVRIVTTPTPILATSLLTYCRNDVSRPIDVTAASGSTLFWVDPNGFVSTQTPTPPTLNATKGGETYQVYAQGSNGCFSSRATVGLVVNTNPTLSLFGSTTVNYGLTAQLTLRFTSQPPYSFTLSDGTTGTTTDSVFRQTVKPLRTTIYQVASVSNVCGIGLSGNPATATVFVNIPTITTQALAGSTSFCAGTNLSVAFSTAGTFNQGNRFKVQIADSTAKVYTDISAESATSPITATIPSAFKGGPYFIRVLATNPGAEVPGERSPTILTVKGLPSAVLTGTQDVFETYPASLSIALAGDSPWAITYTVDGGPPSTISTNANPHILTFQPTKNTTYMLTSVTNNCGSGPVSGTAVVTVLPLLAVEDPLTGALSLYPVPTQNVLTVSIDLPLTVQQPAELMLSDFNGRPVLSRTTENRQTQLDLSQQPAGIYLLSVQVGDRRVVKKVMKL
ncbi:hypothetical protein FAES_0282 [Fibrella aestuarina BUZ 2]|uniref:T9SS type A sorting domain-containing protein n=2 Tax=Fibrella TaxID=861914 RepID=I0K2E3_9BACT|nr:hypothetical protein FAES_0282 [Fibrella aestuarina BUZ 2]